MNIKHLIFGIQASRFPNSFNSPWHTAHEGLHHVGIATEALLNSRAMTLQLTRGPLISVDPLVRHMPPQVLNWIQIWRTSGPEQADEFWMFSKPLVHNPRFVDGAVVLH